MESKESSASALWLTTIVFILSSIVTPRFPKYSGVETRGQNPTYTRCVECQDLRVMSSFIKEKGVNYCRANLYFILPSWENNNFHFDKKLLTSWWLNFFTSLLCADRQGINAWWDRRLCQVPSAASQGWK